MRPFALLAATAIALAACNEGTKSEVSVENAYIRLSAVPGQPAAGYLTIEASADHEALTEISSPNARRVEMHETMTSGSMTMMKPIERIDVDGGEIAFSPGARHLMLFDVDPKVKPGGQAELILRFAHGDPVPVNAKVIAAGDDASH
jgi:copper(I)-binding protein